jgi:hypothetical protein
MLKRPWRIHQKPLRGFWQGSRIQKLHTKSVAYLYANNKQDEKEIRKTIPLKKG